MRFTPVTPMYTHSHTCTRPESIDLGRIGLCLTTLLYLTSVALLTGCGGRNSQPQLVERPTITRDVPPALQGTIGSMSTLRNAEPTVVAGYGLVIGLKDTGSTPERVDIAETVRRNLDKASVSSTSQHFKGTRYEGMTPDQIINDTSTSLVVVIASIPPGLPEGETFDVFVSTLPGSSTVSLEGGQLLETDLRLGQATTFTARQPKHIGVASGSVYVNPFVGDGSLRSDGSGRTGRVLGGGTSAMPLAIQMVLDTPDYLRARAFEQAINSRFARTGMDRQPAARGRNDSTIELHIPFSFRERASEFVFLVQHMQPDTAGATEYAQRSVRTLQEQPGLAVSMSWCLEAIGPAALPQIRTMYDYGEHLPRMAALRAGARLGDVSTVPHLIDVTEHGPVTSRLEAIDLLARLGDDPRIDWHLRELAASSELGTRISAYEALCDRAERVRTRELVAMTQEIASMSEPREYLRALQARARRSLPSGNAQGVTRTVVADKFLLDRVPFGTPLIYVSQTKEPRVTIFGDGNLIEAGSFASIWDDRVMLRTSAAGDTVRVFYEAPAQPGEYRETVEFDAPMEIESFISTLARPARSVTQIDALNLSYSEVVAILSATERTGMLAAGFATEEDRLASELLRAAQTDATTARPATSQERQARRDDQRVLEDGLSGSAKVPTPDEIKRARTYVVPIKGNIEE